MNENTSSHCNICNVLLLPNDTLPGSYILPNSENIVLIFMLIFAWFYLPTDLLINLFTYLLIYLLFNLEL